MVLKDKKTLLQYLSFDLSLGIYDYKSSCSESLSLVKAWVQQNQTNIFNQTVVYAASSSLSLLLDHIHLNSANKTRNGTITVFTDFEYLMELISTPIVDVEGLVIHVPVRKSIRSYLSEISFLQSSNISVLISTNLDQIQKQTILAYLASSTIPVIHLYHMPDSDTPQALQHLSLVDLKKYFVDSQLRPTSINDARDILASHEISMPSFEYYGLPEAHVAISFSTFLPWDEADVHLVTQKPEFKKEFVNELVKNKMGLVQVYQLAPWGKDQFIKTLPSNYESIKLILPLTSESSPSHNNVVRSFTASKKPPISFLNENTRIWQYVFPADDSSSLNVQIGVNHLSKKTTILNYVFKDLLKLYESTGSSEAAFGSILADLHRVEVAKLALYDVSTSPLSTPDIKELALQLASHSISNVDQLKVSLKELKSLLDLHGLDPLYSAVCEPTALVKLTRWLVDHGSLLDINNSLIHSIVSSGENLNVLIIDSNQYSEDQLLSKRDAGLYALNYGGAYVASICPSYSFSQAIQALNEAASFKGPSVVTLLAPNFDSPLEVVGACKKLIDSGLYSLYRWNPDTDNGEPSLQVDSSKAKATLQKFLEKNSNLSLVLEGNIDSSHNSKRNDLKAKVEAQIKSKIQSSYNELFGNLKRKKLLILFGSDGGNAESLAKRIGLEANKKGLFVRTYAGDNFIAEDIVKEDHVLFVVSTAGQGEFPGNFRETWKTLCSKDFNFSSVHYSVFALGDRHYWPRLEDSHYFAKPGKDLDQRLAKLGGKRLTDLGIGDDRDPDGYFTGFGKWVPNFWTSLGVSADAITGPAPPTDDAIKLASNYLRGTIAEGLVDTSTGALAEFDTKLTKFHGIYQQDDRDIREHRLLKGMEKAYSFMIRVRVPGGISTAAQYLAMDEIADKWANGTIKITTRQAFQFHGVVKSVLKRTIQDINRSLLDTIAACGDVNRNVMCNPNPIDSRAHKSVLDLANGLSAHLTPATSAYHEIWLDKKLVAGGEDHEPLYGKTYLPRKFKIAIAVPPSNDVDVLAHDLGYIAIVENGVVIGYNVTVGGGMGQTHGNQKTYPVLAKQLGFCTPSQAIEVGEKVMLIQRDYGERVNRKHARLKYTIEDRGLDWFRSKVEARIGYKLQSPKRYTFTSNGDRYGWSQTEEGIWSYTLFIQNGRIKDTEEYRLKTGLRELAKIHKGGFALTPNQHLIITQISSTEKYRISQLLVEYGIDNNGLSGLRLNSMACVALPTCALAMAESERYLPVLVGKIEHILENNGLRDDEITIRMTGCPNGCARPSIAEIAFIGKAPGIYNMYLGGGFNGERLNKLYRESIDEKEILRLLQPLIEEYAKQRYDGEHFGDYIVRKQVV